MKDYYYALQGYNCGADYGDWDGDGADTRDEALAMLKERHDAWAADGADTASEPQIAVIDNADTDPFCVDIIRYDDINWND
jgi:hypothetical protein